MSRVIRRKWVGYLFLFFSISLLQGGLKRRHQWALDLCPVPFSAVAVLGSEGQVITPIAVITCPSSEAQTLLGKQALAIIGMRETGAKWPFYEVMKYTH